MPIERRFFPGWRPSLPDIRDMIYTAPQPIVAALPPSANIALPLLPAPFEPAWNQGEIGSCGPHSSGKDIVAATFRLQGHATSPMPSRLFIYWCTRYLMGTVNQDSGVDNRSMLKALAQYGWCDEALWPYDVKKFRQQPPDVCFKQAATRKIKEYMAVPQVLNQMKACLAGGDCFIYGFTVYSSMMSSEVERTGRVPMPTQRDQVQGGHDVLMCGYDDATQEFIFCNSWGPWGMAGYGRMPYQYATSSSLSGDFWTVKHSALPAPEPGPGPGPGPGPEPGPGKKIYVSMRIDQTTGVIESATSEIRSENPAAEQFAQLLKNASPEPESEELDEQRITFLADRGWGSREGLEMAAEQGIGVVDLIDWISRYGIGISALFNELVELYRNGQLNLRQAFVLAVRYGPAMMELINEILTKLGIRVPSDVEPVDGGPEDTEPA